MSKSGNIDDKDLIKRIKIGTAAKILSISPYDLILLALAGQFKVEMLTAKGFIVLSKKRLEEAVRYGQLFFGKTKLRPEPKGLSHFERLETARSRLISWPEQVNLSDTYFREKEILKLVENHVSSKAPNKGKSASKKRRSPRLGQQTTTSNRDLAIVSMAKEILMSANGEDFLWDNGKTPNKAKLAGHIFKNYSSNEVLKGQSISRRTIEKALGKLTASKNDWE